MTPLCTVLRLHLERVQLDQSVATSWPIQRQTSWLLLTFHQYQEKLKRTETEFTYPRFPLRASTYYLCPDNMDSADKALISSLLVDETLINDIESATRDQFQSQRWREERKFRLTSSKFDLIVKRKRNFEKFALERINPKQFTSRYVEHDIKNEPTALEAYEKLMFTRKTPAKVLKSGFVVCLDMPILGSSPDGRVVHFGCQDHFGVAEVKCPETKYHVTQPDACQDPILFCKAVNGQCKLKMTHPYFAQVQGDDFIVYTKKGISLERILFGGCCNITDWGTHGLMGPWLFRGDTPNTEERPCCVFA